ncbi:MAG: molybdenum cofactor guanylyltransferase [Pseudomonadota bacterium]
MADTAEFTSESIDGWVLSGGQGSRMGGADKGLLPWQGHPLAWHVAKRLEPQVRLVQVNANRHLSQYEAWPWPTRHDDVDLPPAFGPLAGMLTGLRHCQGDWLLTVPCDTPKLPLDLAMRLLTQAQASGAGIAVPTTQSASEDTPRHHWTCALIRRDLLPTLEAAVGQGHARVRDWITRQPWTGVSFDAVDAFQNFNHPGDLA